MSTLDDSNPRPPTRRTRFVCISDTHNRTVNLPKGDVLIHCGDLTNNGSFTELSKQVAWLENADFECKIVVAGNHDLTLDPAFFAQWGAHFFNGDPQDPIACQNLLAQSPSLAYLCHESRTVKLTSPSGPRTRFSVFGSPHSPEHGRAPAWSAFQYGTTPDGNNEAADALWAQIPLDTDILVTHGPARTHLDATLRGSLAGCGSLQRAMCRVRPRLAVCGHVHEARGVERVRWDLAGAPPPPPPDSNNDDAREWRDPGAGEGNAKISLVDLTARGGSPLDNDGGGSPEARRETCVVNCAVKARRPAKTLNKAIVVDLDLPVWEDE
ncbi:Metallo-dependent phosphatase-like protein [Biscogniauxia mediterranea]|nr:Metallo-dependent phosphatase-like protein [Biscogniauxia mediterranea]